MDDDVTFTYQSAGKPVILTLKWSEVTPSRESLGLWHVENEAWKVYQQTTQLEALKADYQRAAIDAGLPMGDPRFQVGTVQQGSRPVTQGFALITNWMDGSNFQKTIASFRSALNQSNFPTGKTTNDYQR
jgi:hypothetical protein